jgi:flavin-dependent dehydrogenase
VGKDSFDCVIVGARCAGAPLATHLSRRGMTVCLLDQDKLPSDQPFSTHAIMPLGMDYLDELGVGAKIRLSTPAVHASRLAVGRAHVDLPLSEGRAMYCPRRSTLDPLLAETAVSAGAELEDETTVLDVIRDGDRVAGVCARHAGHTREIRARVVVGADGRNSTIAKLVGAEEYLGTDGARGGYWAYFPITKEFASLPFQTYIEIKGTAARFAFQTDGGLVIAGALDTVEVARAWARARERHVTASLAMSDVIRPLVQGNPAATRFVGLIGGRCFFRSAVGPGWALVGDAGLHMDPTPGYGITDALRDAKALAGALLDGREAALDVYWRERDVESIPLFANALAMGSLDYDNPFNEVVLDRLGSTPVLGERLRATIEREVSPFDMVPIWRVLGWTASALLRGHLEIWPHFLASGKRGTWVKDQVLRSQALLAQAKQRLDVSG